MKSTIHNEVVALLQRGEQAQPVLITDAHLNRLPEVVQRYLRYAQVVGKESIRTVRAGQKGMYRTQPGKRWFPMVAEQYVTTKPPAFLWHMTSQLFPLVSISVTDRFSAGHGNLRVKLWSLITMGNARGPEMDEGELQRYLAEVAYYPTACLSDAIEWQTIDDSSVKATIRQQGITASAVLHVDGQGQLTHVTTERYMEEHGRYRLEPWSGQYSEYKEVDGMRIPTRFEVTWHLKSGDFNWLQGEITEIEYNQSGKVTRL
ncbi:MAG TPA: DUF6544 family protein [Ktedonobacteraceae bacterium]|nr:DUF6544 family protein [Ktedonobacteraceae bacterium]